MAVIGVVPMLFEGGEAVARPGEVAGREALRLLLLQKRESRQKTTCVRSSCSRCGVEDVAEVEDQQQEEEVAVVRLAAVGLPQVVKTRRSLETSEQELIPSSMLRVVGQQMAVVEGQMPLRRRNEMACRADSLVASDTQPTVPYCRAPADARRIAGMTWQPLGLHGCALCIHKS